MKQWLVVLLIACLYGVPVLAAVVAGWAAKRGLYKGKEGA